MLTYIYLNVEEYWLPSSMHDQTFKLQMYLNYANIKQNVGSWSVVDGHGSFDVVWVHITLLSWYKYN